jgi:flagellar L-ring protein precursor FlgH
MSNQLPGKSGRFRVVVSLTAAILLSACNVTDRVMGIGAAPELSHIDSKVVKTRQPVRLPMPRQRLVRHQPNSLWRPGSRAFFKDQRANQIGDILTVNIVIDDEATIENETARSRSGTEDASLGALLGYEAALSRILPEAISNTSLIDADSDSSFAGSGTVDRKETINLTVAAIVSQLLPNGNMVIAGSQEVRVNYEKRVLTVSGVVRPEDISSTNTIRHTQIAEARISYGGVGQLTDVQQPRYGQQLFDIVFPF